MVLKMSLALNRRVSESACLCYVDHDVALHKEFIGLYTVSETTDEGIAKVATDVLLRHKLPMSGLRGQSYGASNMAGKYTGAQAIVRRQFHNKYPCSSSGEAAEGFRRLPVEVRGLFDQFEVLIRILFVVPVSSCEAEKSFSALRRFKTWLRSSMGVVVSSGNISASNVLDPLKPANVSLVLLFISSVVCIAEVLNIFGVLEPLHMFTKGRQGFERSSVTHTQSILYVKLLESLCC